MLELKPGVGECLEKALAAENTELETFRAWAARVKTPKAYQACQAELVTSQEGQALRDEYRLVPLALEAVPRR